MVAMGALSLGLSSTNLLKGEVIFKPRSVKKESIKTDILIVGGGTSGTIAAIQAARAGKKTVLVENGSMLGGTTTTGGVAFPAYSLPGGNK